MKASDPKHQVRWRVSERSVAELSCLRREYGCRSWDEFLRTIPERLQQHRPQTVPPATECGVRAEVEKLNRRMESWEARQERHEEGIEVMRQELTETLEAVRRIADLLGRAMSASAERPPSPLDSLRRQR